MKALKNSFLILFLGVLLNSCAVQTSVKTPKGEPWGAEKANQWYKKQGWLIGSNYAPAYAINQLEMWQEETFDTLAIDKELGWAESLGMNTMRVFLHDLLYEQDSTGFFERMDVFLRISNRHGIKPMFVIFDSVWDPYPRPGKQREPKPHVHNSGWVQSPGADALKDTTQHPRLEKYVKAVVGKFAKDERVLAWDLWNEPDNANNGPYGKVELPNKAAYVLALLTKTFAWAREMNPEQPLTAGVWKGNWSSLDSLSSIDRLMIAQSDIISFHNYDNPAEFEKRIKWLQQYKKPIVCTEYMARPNGSTFQGSLPLAQKYNIGMYNWGFVNGKTQTIYPWDSWDKQYTAEPPLWFHDIFRADGTPYKTEEVDLIRKFTRVPETVNE